MNDIDLRYYHLDWRVRIRELPENEKSIFNMSVGQNEQNFSYLIDTMLREITTKLISQLPQEDDKSSQIIRKYLGELYKNTAEKEFQRLAVNYNQTHSCERPVFTVLFNIPNTVELQLLLKFNKQ